MRHQIHRAADPQGIADVRPQECEAGMLQESGNIIQPPGREVVGANTESPRLSKASHKWEPRNPAPPVTKARMYAPQNSGFHHRDSSEVIATGGERIASAGRFAGLWPENS